VTALASDIALEHSDDLGLLGVGGWTKRRKCVGSFSPIRSERIGAPGSALLANMPAPCPALDHSRVPDRLIGADELTQDLGQLTGPQLRSTGRVLRVDERADVGETKLARRALRRRRMKTGAVIRHRGRPGLFPHRTKALIPVRSAGLRLGANVLPH
jgi:hypothetical protein